jgi:hypothetical protein
MTQWPLAFQMKIIYTGISEYEGVNITELRWVSGAAKKRGFGTEAIVTIMKAIVTVPVVPLRSAMTEHHGRCDWTESYHSQLWWSEIWDQGISRVDFSLAY